MPISREERLYRKKVCRVFGPQTKRGAWRPVPSEDNTLLREMWLAGVKAEAIAQALGVTYDCVKKRKQRLGLPPRPQNPRKVQRVNSIETLNDLLTEVALRLWRINRMDTKQIADRLRVTEAAVYNSLANRRGKHEPVDPKNSVDGRPNRDAERPLV